MIRVEAVSKGGIIHDVSFSIERGIVALLGRNGAGKTTLMRLLTGIWRPDAGRIAIGGHDLAGEPVEAKRLFGFQPEFPELHPAMRGRELLDVAAAARGLSADAVAQAVERFDAASVLDKKTGSLSQGQKRLITLVAATMHNPPVLFLDEPTNALDPHRVAALKTYLAQTPTALISTHQLDFVATIAERYVLIAGGRIVGDGTLEELREQLGMPGATLEAIVLRAT